MSLKKKVESVMRFASKSKKRGKHSKKASVAKSSKNYSKPYRAQGR